MRGSSGRIWWRDRDSELSLLFEVKTRYGARYMEFTFLGGRINRGNKRIRLRHTRFDYFWGRVVYSRFPEGKNYILVDSCFLNKYTGPHYITGIWK